MKYTKDNHKHEYEKNREGVITCKFCWLSKSTIEATPPQKDEGWEKLKNKIANIIVRDIQVSYGEITNYEGTSINIIQEVIEPLLSHSKKQLLERVRERANKLKTLKRDLYKEKVIPAGEEYIKKSDLISILEGEIK